MSVNVFRFGIAFIHYITFSVLVIWQYAHFPERRTLKCINRTRADT